MLTGIGSGEAIGTLFPTTKLPNPNIPSLPLPLPLALRLLLLLLPYGYGGMEWDESRSSTPYPIGKLGV